MAFEFSNILASSKSHNNKNMDVTTGSFNSNDGTIPRRQNVTMLME